MNVFPFTDRISQHTFLRAPLTHESVVGDLGCNQGLFAVGVRKKYGCRVWAAEPAPHLHKALTHLAPGIRCMPVAVGGARDRIFFNFDESHRLSGSLLAKEIIQVVHDRMDKIHHVSVDVITLADFIDFTGSPRIDLLKMDIEGAELEVLLNSPLELLQRCAQITVEFHDFWYPELKSRTEQAKTRLVQAGFEMIRFTPNNKDVLFINRAMIDLSLTRRFFVAHVERNLNGAGRALLVASRRFRSKM